MNDVAAKVTVSASQARPDLPRAPRCPTAHDLETLGADRFLRLNVPRNPAATNLTYTVEVCDDLAAGVWQPGAYPPEIDTPTQLRIRDTVPAGTAPHRFIRLKVSVTQP